MYLAFDEAAAVATVPVVEVGHIAAADDGSESYRLRLLGRKTQMSPRWAWS